MQINAQGLGSVHNEGVKSLNASPGVAAVVASPARMPTVPQAQGFENARLAREFATVGAMVRIYCKGQGHETFGSPLCASCHSLLEYARVRLQRCVFGGEKPTCAKCPVHCYQPTRRDEMKGVMRYAGPRMLWHHPILSLRHWMDSWADAPEKP